jgi:hypothetical protein
MVWLRAEVVGFLFHLTYIPIALYVYILLVYELGTAYYHPLGGSFRATMHNINLRKDNTWLDPIYMPRPHATSESARPNGKMVLSLSCDLVHDDVCSYKTVRRIVC